MGWGGEEGEGWGEPRACGCPAPCQWTARTAPPIPLWRDRIRLGPGGCPQPRLPLPRPLPTGVLFVPASRSHVPLVLFVKCRQENQRELGELPGCWAPRDSSAVGTSGGNGGRFRGDRGVACEPRWMRGCVGAAHVGSGPAGAVKVAARETARDNAVLVS